MKTKLCFLLFFLAFTKVVSADDYMENIYLIRNELEQETFEPTKAKKPTILNVSYDPTREFYEEINPLFTKFWQEKTGQKIEIMQSHGGAGKQARAVIDGIRADVVTLALAYDIDEIAKRGIMANNWQNALPHNNSPYVSTIVFLVRKGNPKNIKDWDDLVKENISVITPNPKTSGGARWNYLASYGYALKKYNNDEDKAFDFVKNIFKNVAVLDTGARGSTTTFVQRRIGDVLITWENEAFLAVKQFGEDEFDIIVPSISILAEPPVGIVDSVVDANKTRDLAETYLKFLYTETAQRIAGKHFYRPIDKNILNEYKDVFPTINMMTINDFGGWEEAQKIHFNDNGKFDKIFDRKGN